MVQLKPFDVEQWIGERETVPGVLNISETCCDSLSVADLVSLSQPAALDGASVASPLSTSMKLTYGAIQGTPALRSNIAALYSDAGFNLSPDRVVVYNGAIGANFVLLYTLVAPGDHVVCVYPTYQQLYDVPASLGADVSLWRLRAEDGWVPDLAELRRLVRADTKLIILNNPNNPTGVPIPESVLRGVVDIARERGITVFSDEVYRPLFHSLPLSSPTPPPTLLALGYEKAVVSGSMSKAFALAGLRLGWVATNSAEIAERCMAARDYTTISVGRLDDAVASFALSESVVGNLLKRNEDLARTNLEVMDKFVKRHGKDGEGNGKWVVEWIRPTAGTTAFVKFVERETGEPVDDAAFCDGVLKAINVLIVPGRWCFGQRADFKGYVRIGYVCDTELLKEAMDKLSGFLDVSK